MTPRTAAAPAPGDLAVLLFTAGTAGAPKPAMLTHGSLLANLEQMQSHPGLRVEAADVALGVLPLFHVYGLNVVLGLALHAGAAVALVDHFHPVETLARIRADKVTVVAGVPAIYDAWLGLDETAASRASFATVRLCVSGATTLLAETVTGMRDRFGVTVHDGYGLTEASPVVTTTAVAPEPRPGSIGPPLPGVEVELLDPRRASPRSRAIRASSSCGDPTSSRGTGTTPPRRTRCSSTAGCTPATSPSRARTDG